MGWSSIADQDSGVVHESTYQFIKGISFMRRGLRIFAYRSASHEVRRSSYLDLELVHDL